MSGWSGKRRGPEHVRTEHGPRLQTGLRGCERGLRRRKPSPCGVTICEVERPIGEVGSVTTTEVR